MYTILDIKAREILDSRGNPTVEVDVTLSDQSKGRFSVPSGASTGSREALEMRDGDKNRYLGKGVQQAVTAVNDIIRPALWGKNALNQEEIDKALIVLDGTENKSKLGANAILGVSMAVAKAAANNQKMPFFGYLAGLYKTDRQRVLPTPMMNVINGGSHADNSLDIQEFMVMPVGAKTISEAIRMGAEIFHNLKKLLKNDGFNTAVGDEGGFAPDFKNNEQAFEYLTKAVEVSGYKLGEEVGFAIDAAASEFLTEKGYEFKSEGRILSSQELVEYYEKLVAKYPIISLEDGMGEADNAGWKLLTERLGDKIQLVGDDNFVTNPEIFAEGIDAEICNAILIKLNQIGTLTETLQTVKMAEENGYSAIISHRSGETEDSSIADLAVATGCGQIKTGSLSRSDRNAKYNQLIRIEEMLGERAVFAGRGTIVNG